MGLGSGLTTLVYVGFASLLVFVGNTYFTQPFQNAATSLFGTLSANLQVQLYMFDVLIVGMVFLLRTLSIRGMRGEGRSRERHYQKSLGH